MGRTPVVESALAVDGVDEFLSVLGNARWVAKNLRDLEGSGALHQVKDGHGARRAALAPILNGALNERRKRLDRQRL